MLSTVRISKEAAALVLATAAENGYAKPGLVVHRIAPIGDVRRTETGQAEWKIERPNSWRIEVRDFSKHAAVPELTRELDEGRIQLLLLPPQAEAAVDISLKAGELHAETPDA